MLVLRTYLCLHFVVFPGLINLERLMLTIGFSVNADLITVDALYTLDIGAGFGNLFQ